MDVINKISEVYKKYAGISFSEITPLPKSGSERLYFRVHQGDQTLIAAYNANHEENEAFIGFTRHFLNIKLPVPSILGYFPEKFIYFLEDLGDVNLYTWLHNRDDISDFNDETKALYRKILDNLILFQVKGIRGLDLELCYPHRSFDRQSMMWDLNYFKYMLLKLLSVPFNERRLENDFNILADFLLETRQDYFLYRDFQTANIMIVDDKPWFIDYQGGRKGAPQYDVASLLNDAKIPMSENDRRELLKYYTDEFCRASGENKNSFIKYYDAFGLIRIMQALGAFGFRGLYERKPTFTESIVPGVHLLLKISEAAAEHVNLPELYSAIRSIEGTHMFKNLKDIQGTA